jgi:hypothetical protein
MSIRVSYTDGENNKPSALEAHKMKIDSLVESIKALPPIDFARLKNLILSGELGYRKNNRRFLDLQKI